VPDLALTKMAKLGVVTEQWMKQTDVTVSAVQCWTSLERESGHRAVHCDEHDERQSAFERLRSGCVPAR